MSENQTQNQTQPASTTPVHKTAVKILLESNVDDVFLVDSDVVRLEKGRYGGWLLRGEGPESGRGLWCYAIDEQEAPGDAVEKVSWAKERMMKAASSLGVKEEPKAFLLTHRFRIVDVAQKKATERYTVYDVVPSGEEAEATLIAIKFEVRMSKRGKCYNDVCRVRERLAMLLKAEFKGEEAAVDGVTVLIPYDTSKLEEAVAKLMDVDEAAAEEAVEEGGGEENEERTVSGGDNEYVKYFIVVKLPSKDEGVVAKLEEAVRQKLKELNVTALVMATKADL
ncbi:MAG: hypothetical protein RXR01_09055 [Thermoproteus sp.]